MITEADRGNTIRLQVVAKGPGNREPSAIADSAPTGVVKNVPPVNRAPAWRARPADRATARP